MSRLRSKFGRHIARHIHEDTPAHSVTPVTVGLLRTTADDFEAALAALEQLVGVSLSGVSVHSSLRQEAMARAVDLLKREAAE